MSNAKRFEVIDSEKAAELKIPSFCGRPEEHFWLVIENLPDGSKRIIGEDGGEPEDQLLVRDWKWVAEALNEAYEQGFQDGVDVPTIGE